MTSEKLYVLFDDREKEPKPVCIQLREKHTLSDSSDLKNIVGKEYIAQRFKIIFPKRQMKYLTLPTIREGTIRIRVSLKGVLCRFTTTTTTKVVDVTWPVIEPQCGQNCKTPQ